ncbi:transferase [Campylobacter lari]|uniref:acyltransferase n=1 Tax=Campylobacter TaxID=194 RepID=UPI00178F9AA0|nr:MULTISPECIES: transferase [Campylobacter]MCR8711882.1 transferase [Campylobacter sp. W0066.1]EAI7261969.1 transferase [Campylobacter lari]MCR6525960.1 transferase [Campylobacter lari]MCV3385951.1 transferase [Campylobacter lari]MCV3391531.1 transferase [Campylobacter sp. IFREMER_LSEM_CL2101]
MNQIGFYTRQELLELGFKKIGENVLISKKTSLYNIACIEILDNVRIDDFVILIGPINIKSYVHIGAGSILTGGIDGITVENFVGISSGCKIFSVTDDYTGMFMSNPMVPNEYKNVLSRKIIIEKHCLIGSNSVVLPNSGGLAEGVSVGALSLVMRKTKPYGIYFGAPAKRIAERNKNVLELEKKLIFNIKEK